MCSVLENDTLSRIFLTEGGISTVGSTMATHIGAEHTTIVSEIAEVGVEVLFKLLRFAAAHNFAKSDELVWRDGLISCLRY